MAKRKFVEPAIQAAYDKFISGQIPSSPSNGLANAFLVAYRTGVMPRFAPRGSAAYGAARAGLDRRMTVSHAECYEVA